MKTLEETSAAASGLRTLERGLDVLDLFCHGAAKFSLTEISSKINLSPSTASRLLHTLLIRGYISRDEETKKFGIGPQALRLTATSFRTFDLRPVAAPFLRKLAEKYNESLSLYVVQDSFRVCIDRIETTHALRHVVNIGDRLPLARGAGGKALLAWVSQDELRKVQAEGETISPIELEQIRKQGFAISLGERDKGVGAVAAPVFDGEGHIQGSLSLAAPLARIDRASLEKIAPELVNVANQISAALGYVK